MNLVSSVCLFLTVCALITTAIFVYRNRERWSNSYSGWPGPLETGCSSCYNIPALHPRYNADKHYKYGLDKTSPYMTMAGYP